jgi:hypothetical protein
MAIKGGHLVARYLKEVEGIETVFALSGGHIEAILDGFTQYRIRAIDVRHEQVAAMARMRSPASRTRISTTPRWWCCAESTRSRRTSGAPSRR